METYQTEQPCIACGESYLDRCFHHIKTRGSGGTDDSYNLMPLCFLCHTEIHLIGMVKMADRVNQFGDYRHKQMRKWLLDNEWHLENGKYINRKGI